MLKKDNLIKKLTKLESRIDLLEAETKKEVVVSEFQQNKSFNFTDVVDLNRSINAKLATFPFETAFKLLKEGKAVTRVGFRDTCYIVAQFPTQWSKMTLPYLYMVKGDLMFPVTLSTESLFADDWYEKQN